MRLAIIPVLGVLIAGPAMAQGYYYPAPGYQTPYNGREAAHLDWQRAHRAEEVARWRAANGDYEGANRARYWAERQRERAREEAGGWRWR